MRSTLQATLLLLVAGLLTPSVGYGQTGDLPIDPDSIYTVANESAERITQGHQIPDRLSAAEWQADLDTLAARIHRQIPYAEAATGGAAFHRRLDSLKRAIPHQTRDQRILSVMRLLNLPAAGTGHTQINPFQRAVGWRAFPVKLYRFDDGVYVMSAADSSLIGSEVLSIGGTPVDSVYAALTPYEMGDNRWSRDTHVSEDPLVWANPLKAVGIVEDIDTIPMRVRNADGAVRRVSVETMMPDTPAYVRYITSASTYPDVPESKLWSAASWQQDFNLFDVRPYRISYRDTTDLLYLGLVGVINASNYGLGDMTTADLADSLRAIADARPVDKFVLDLRYNTGGNAGVTPPLTELMSTHPKISQRGTLYVLVGPVTNSAAGIFSMRLERRTDAIFAGQPSGFSPNIWGENTRTMLPNSKISMTLSFHYKGTSMPDEPRTYLDPDIRVPYTSEQHFQNVDSTMIAVKRHELAPRKTVSLSAAERERFTGTYRMSPIHRVEIADGEEGLHLRMDRGEKVPFVDTDLHPLSSERLATDVTDVYVERRPGEAGLTLAWKDTTYALEPVGSGFTLPLEHIRAGRLEEGAAGFREAEAQGIKLASSLMVRPLTDLIEEQTMPTWPDSMSETERARRALPYTRLATELAPKSWLAHFELAYVHKRLGQTEAMRRAAQRAVRLAPLDGADLVREWLDLTVTADGRVE